MSTTKTRPEDCATAWFAVLERAQADGDTSRAAQARRELERLGVDVRFPHKERPQPRYAPASAAAIIGASLKAVKEYLRRLRISQASITPMVLLSFSAFVDEELRSNVTDDAVLALAKHLANQTEDELRARLSQGYEVIRVGSVDFDVAAKYLALILSLQQFHRAGGRPEAQPCN